jgi:hypothetical protein
MPVKWDRVGAIAGIFAIAITGFAIFVQVATPEIRCYFGLNQNGCFESTSSTSSTPTNPNSQKLNTAPRKIPIPTSETSAESPKSLESEKPSPQNIIDEDYRDLQRFLDDEQWEYADIETRKILLKIGKENLNNVEHIEDFLNRANNLSQGDKNVLKLQKSSKSLLYTTVLIIPCDVFKRIDLLWHNASKGKFGFSVQKRIYIETTQANINNKSDWVGEIFSFRRSSWAVFAENVNWTGPSFIDGANLIPPRYILDAETSYGHLPSYVVLFDDPDDLTKSHVSLGMHHIMFRLNQCGL